MLRNDGAERNHLRSIPLFHLLFSFRRVAFFDEFIKMIDMGLIDWLIILLIDACFVQKIFTEEQRL